MNIDTFLKIGHSHTICQDYILSGNDPCPYIILSDGCSQSKDSDIGARILCYTTLKFLKRHGDDPGGINAVSFGDKVITEAAYIAKVHFNINIECLDATLIIAYKYSDFYRILMYGDGVIYIQKQDGINYYRAKYNPNIPYYLRYNIKGKIDYLDNDVKYQIDKHDGQFNPFSSIMPFDLLLDANGVKSLLVASDGVESFIFKEETAYKTLYLDLLRKEKTFETNPERKELDFVDVCSEFTNFKLTKGAFLSRRVKKVMKEYLKLGFVNDDDVSIGCFYED